MSNSRLQCLNAAKNLKKQAGYLRAALSTSRAYRSDNQVSSQLSPMPKLTSWERLHLAAESGSSRTSASTPPAPKSSHQTILGQTKTTSSDQPYANPIADPPLPQPMGAYQWVTDAKRAREEEKKRLKAVAGPTEQPTGLVTANGTPISSDALAKNIGRIWKPGEIYSPKDLHQNAQKRFKKWPKSSRDVFDALNINPLDHYRNFSMMSEWMTPMGRIKHSNETALRPVNQRRIAKAIRRAIGIGIMPSVHRHPEILYKNRLRQQQDSGNYSWAVFGNASSAASKSNGGSASAM